MDSVNPAPPTGAIGAAINVRIYRIRALVRRHWWILLLTIGAGLAFEGWVAYKKPDAYESNSEIMVRDEVNVDDSRKIVNESHETLWGNTLKMLQSSEVAEGARRQLEIQAPELTGQINLVAINTPRTSIFTITGTGSNPEYTRRFVDAAVAEFMKQYRALKSGDISETKEEVTATLAQVRKELAKEKGELDEFVKQNNMQFWQRQMEESVNFLSGLKTRQAEINTEIQRLKTLTADQLLASPTAHAPQSGNGQAGAGAQPDSLLGGELVQMYLTVTQELQAKQARIEERSKVWKPKHPKFQLLQDEANQLRSKIEWITKQTEKMMDARRATIESELKSLDISIASWTEKVKEASEKDGQFKVLAGGVKRLQDQEDKLISGLSKIETTAQNGILKVTHKATPASLVAKGTIKQLLVGLIGGLLVGALIIFVLNRSDDRLNSSTEIIEHFTEPILGQIPDVSDARSATGLPLIQVEDERFAYAEAFRSLRSSLIFMPNQADLKTLLITSAIPNEGKSTLASNLAITMAASGARVLLIDGDLRRGDISPMFDVDGKVGLSNVLRGEANWQSTVQNPALYPSLSVIPRGPVTNQSAELFLKPLIPPMLEEMKAEYDLVILNTAPILATDDTPTVAPHFDGVLMVMRAGFTSARLTRNALQALYSRQVNVLGLIFNCVDTEMPDYYYYRYSKYYAA